MQQVQQALAAVQDIFQVTPLLIVDFTRYFIEHQLGKADDNIQLRTDVMGQFSDGAGFR